MAVDRSVRRTGRGREGLRRTALRTARAFLCPPACRRAALPTLDPSRGAARYDDGRQSTGLQGRRPLPRRLRPQGDHPRRARDARPDVHPQGVRRRAAAGRRPHHRFAAHDRADGRADRDPGRPRRRGPLGLLQHLLHPGPRGRGHRGRPRGHPRGPRRRPGLRLEGRVAGGVLVVHGAGPDLAEHPHRWSEHDPRRRW